MQPSGRGSVVTAWHYNIRSWCYLLCEASCGIETSAAAVVMETFLRAAKETSLDERMLGISLSYHLPVASARTDVSCGLTVISDTFLELVSITLSSSPPVSTESDDILVITQEHDLM